MIEIIGGRLTQWDHARSVQVTNSEATHVHFANPGDVTAVIMKLEDGKAFVPDYLLHTGKAVMAYAVLNGVTVEVKSFPVTKREKPEGYVYEEDTRNYIYAVIAEAEKATDAANKAADAAHQAVQETLDVNVTNESVTKALGYTPAKHDDVDKLSKELAVERERMNTFASLPEGSTVGDAELADARVDKDGNTHANVGEHIRAVTGQLSEQIGDLADVNFGSDNKCNPDTNVVGQLLNDGTVDQTKTQSDTSDFIPVPDGVKYVVPSYNGYNGVFYHRICFYNSAKALIRYVSSGNAAFEIPVDTKYVRVSEPSGNAIYCGFNNDGSYGGFVEYREKSVKLKESVLPEELFEMVQFVPKLFNDTYNGNLVGYVSTDGTFIADNGAKRTDFIELGDYDKINYIDSLSNLGYTLAFYDGSKTLLPSVSVKGSYVQRVYKTIRIPDDAKYVIYSEYGQSDGGVIELYNSNSVESILNSIMNGSHKCGISSFMKFGVVGDSLSVGHTTNPYSGNDVGRNIKYSWGQYIARRNGNICLNFGKTGMTAKSWMSDDKCYDLLVKSENKCQCYVLALGANDAEHLTSVPLGTINDINFNDMSQNADTFYGWYAKVINTIYTVNNRAPIFVFTLPYPRNTNEDVKSVNNAIREIANDSRFNNLCLVDLSADYDEFFHNELVFNELVNAHFTAKGYNTISMIIEMAVSNYMNYHREKFDGIPFIDYGTNDVID